MMNMKLNLNRLNSFINSYAKTYSFFFFRQEAPIRYHRLQVIYENYVIE
jgi:hypothetical protein